LLKDGLDIKRGRGVSRGEEGGGIITQGEHERRMMEIHPSILERRRGLYQDGKEKKRLRGEVG